MIFFSFLNRTSLKFDNFSDFLLPSAVNEFRQMVKSKFFNSVFLICSVCFIFIAVGIFLIKDQGQAGPWGYLLFSGIMDVALIIFIPMLLYQNMSAERSNGSFELMAITTISPLKIVLGKWQSGIMQAIIFGSFILPGLIYCYFFDGIALSTIFVGIFFTLLISQFALLGSIFLCSLVSMKAGRVFFQLVSLIITVLLLWLLWTIKKETAFEDEWARHVFKFEFLKYFSLFLLFIFTVELFFIVVSAARLSSFSANKSTAPRIVYFIIVLEVICFIFYTHEFFYYYSWPLIIILSIHSFLTLFFLVENDDLSLVLIKKLNRKNNFMFSFIRRFFYPGRSSALFLFIAQAILFMATIIYSFNNFKGKYYGNLDIFSVLATLCCFVFYICVCYLAFSLLSKIMSNAHLFHFFLVGILIASLIFAFPFFVKGFLFRGNSLVYSSMNPFIYDNVYKTGLPYVVNGTITIIVGLISLVVAIIKDNRKVLLVRNFSAGERGDG